jgi:hypothetical protein
VGTEHLRSGTAPAALSGGDGSALPAGLPLELAALERIAIREALRRVNGNRTHAARLLGIGLRTLRNKLRAWREEQVLPPADPAARHFLPGETCRPVGNVPSSLAPVPARPSQEGRA